MNEKSELAVFDGYNKQKIEVMFQEEANLEVKMPLFYVNSGKKELEAYVENNSKPELTEYTISKQEELSMAVEEVHKPELKSYTESRKEDILYYVESTSKPEIDDYVDAEVVPHSTLAQSSAAAALSSEQAAKVSEYNAKESETSAAASAAEAKQYRDEAEEIIRPVQATEDSLGLAEIATAEDVAAGVNDTKFVTPLKASEYYQSKTAANSEYESIQSTLAQKADKSELFSAGNIGDIKYTSRTDVPNGGAWCDGAEYTKATFPDIYQMLVDGKLSSTDFTTFDNSVSTNGSCGFFALDTTNEKFKVPLLKDVYIKAGQSSSIFGAESLPNITGTAPSVGIASDSSIVKYSGSFVFKDDGTSTKIGTASSASHTTYTDFNASLSSSVYQDGAKVNPDHIVYRAYVVLYSSSTEASVAQTEEFMAALAGKANADMSNVDAVWASRASKPSNRYVDFTLQASGTQYTAPANGIFHLVRKSTANGFDQLQNMRTAERKSCGNNTSIWTYAMLSIDAEKGDVVVHAYSGTTNTTYDNFIRFYYDEGAE